MKSNRYDSTKMPWHGWLLGIIFTLFGLGSTFDFVLSLIQGEAYYRSSGMTDSQVAHFMSIPLWAMIAWLFSVAASFFAAVALLLKHRFSILLFTLSVIGTLIYIVYSYALSEGKVAMGMLWPMPFFIITITIGMVFYTKKLFSQGIFR
jgi:hypothetical protein